MRAFPVVLLALAFFATPARADFVYGIADSGQLYEIDTVGQTATSLFDTGFASEPNALAYDAGRSLLLYRATDNGDLYAWNRALNQQSLVATSTQLGGGSANAAFYDNAYWFVRDGTDDLYRIALNFTGAFPTFVPGGRTEFLDFDGTAAGSFSFGDIAITSGGLLYGNTSGGTFFSVNLSGGTPSGYAQLGTGGQSLQLALSADQTTLFGQSFVTGEWYNVNMANGQDGTSTFTTLGFRDLGGSAATPASVPEPGVLALMAAGLIAGAVVVRRRCSRDMARGALETVGAK